MVARLQELTGVALPEAGVSTRALCALSRVDVDWSACTSHPRAHPAGIDRVAEDPRANAAPGKRRAQQRAACFRHKREPDSRGVRSSRDRVTNSRHHGEGRC